MSKIINYISVSFLFIFACAFCTSTYAAAPTYKLVDLGLQESDQSEAVAVNDNGQIAGSYWMFGKKNYFLWHENSGITLIDLPESANIAVLNNAGLIAGNYKDASGRDRGFIWNPCFGFFDIGTLGGDFTRVYDMNDLGQIVGQSESSNVSIVDGNKEQHAFLWQCGYMIDVGSLAGDLGVLGDRSVATSINNRGQIIGTSNSLIAHKRKFLRTNNRAVVWQNGVIEEIDSTLDSEFSAIAKSVNNAGIATFGHGQYGYFAVDLADKSKKLFSINNFGCPFAVTDDKDIFVIMEASTGLRDIYLGFLKSDDSKEICYDGNFYAYVYFPTDLDSPKEWKPNSFAGADFNNKRWIVGTAANIYGERHSVLLIPVTK